MYFVVASWNSGSRKLRESPFAQGERVVRLVFEERNHLGHCLCDFRKGFAAPQLVCVIYAWSVFLWNDLNGM
jgi:hypothetical protein